MKVLKSFLFIVCMVSYLQVEPSTGLPFNKVIIWGHKLHSHTHSYIHYAFYRAFEYLGYDAYWFDAADNLEDFDFSSSLFITEGQVDKNIPLRDDCRYVLHNCQQDKYESLIKNGNCVVLQVYTHDCLPRNVQKLQECIYIDRNDLCIYMPWATDLLPYEIDYIKEQMSSSGFKKDNAVYFIGTIGGGVHGNNDQIELFKQACAENNITFIPKINLSAEETLACIQSSIMAPAIQGKWQVDNGYVPCRIFKNISYGAIGGTNSETVWKLFNKQIVYSPDTYQLFYQLYEKVQTISLDEQFAIMDFVKEKHTYLNRIEHLLFFINMVKPLSNY